ncbi:hypothetical protein EBZ39_05065 [bacterium]|nr:hypothetical protein [bacterium]
MSASQVLKGSPAGLTASGDGSTSFQNAALTGVKSLTGGDAAGLAITATGAGGLDLLATAGGVVVGGAGQTVGFHGVPPVAQNTSATAAAPRVAAGGAAPVLDDTTYGVVPNVYTIGQIVAALRQHGILA